MKEDREMRFVCKLCNKKYPCGKSLGGHMRSHVIANSAESDEKVQSNMKKISSLGSSGKNINKESRVDEFGNGQSSNYGLRENPKKSWRAEDSRFPLPQEKICKQCGKGFQSLKALCGHMACHSETERGLKDDHSWTSDNQKVVMDSDSDAELEDRRRPRTTRSSKCKRYKRIVVKSSSFCLPNVFSSSGSDIEEQEQEDLAMCLMMLSRDSGNRDGVNSMVESSDNNSVVLETKSSSFDMRIDRKEGLNYVLNGDVTPKLKKIGDMKSKNSVLDAEIAEVENSDSGYFLDECTKTESDVSMDGFHRNGGSGECKKPLMNLNKFKSYKTELSRDYTKENGNDDADRDSNFPRIESRKRKYTSENLNNGSPDAKVCNKLQKRSKYECLNCKKTFNSYQALGGHRPCHITSNAHFESRRETGENSLDDATYFRTIDKFIESPSSNRKPTTKSSSQYAEKRIKPMQNKGHVCPFCHRVFKNGQALGGHKRSHFINGHAENSTRTPINKPELPDLLDLNLPAPAEDEDYRHGQLFAW
ncbi:C2H2-like zinc finger protein [Forsythia ovata]|uniref:C2H2-like zinc finger protein n=1 Tax=Forsythia ovata TaxID=205694 RepID=A0ABD1TBQ9_9LAMI